MIAIATPMDSELSELNGSEPRAAGDQGFGDDRPIERDRAVRLHENEQHVGVADPAEVGRERWMRRGNRRRAAAHLHRQQTGLLPVSEGHRRRHGHRRQQLSGRGLGRELADHGQRQHRQSAAHGRRPHHGGHRGKGPAGGQVDERQQDQHRGHRRDEDWRGHGVGHHRRDGSDVPQIPIEVDRSPVERRRHHVDVAADDECHPYGGHAADQPRHGPSRSAPRHERQQQDGRRQLRRQVSVPLHARRGPDVVKGDRGVQEDQRHEHGGHPRQDTHD